MLLLAYLMILLGLAALLWHVLLIRPSQPFSRWLQVNGLPMLFLLWYVRALVLLILSGGADYTGRVDGSMAFRLLSGFLIDALVIERVRSFTRFRRAYIARERELGDVKDWAQPTR